jgi:hypothetical protein
VKNDIAMCIFLLLLLNDAYNWFFWDPILYARTPCTYASMR